MTIPFCAAPPFYFFKNFKTLPKIYKQRLLHSHIDQVYVLSVKSFKDRITHTKNQMSSYGIPFVFIFDYDIPQLSKSELKVFGESQLTMAQKSLVLKHIQAWKDALKHHHKHVLIFEDDVILDKNFHEKLEKIIQAMKTLPQDFLIFLGGGDTKVPEHFFLTQGPLVELPLATTEGYIVDLPSIKKRVQWLKNHKINLPADHLIVKIDQDNKTRHYWSKEPLVEQGSVTGKFITKLDQHRLKHSKFFNTLRYHWNKIQRRKLRSFIVKLKYYLRKKS
jgi:glycosyl transferase, family 25